ncbi:MAG: spermidine synthase [Campylobacterales bacterium]|nr:spermidine synthase [Campylobacterales bacterium]
MANLENKNFAFDEMMVHVPMCSHKDINKILVVGSVSDEFKQELNKHECKDVTYVDSLNIEGSFDIILYTKSQTPDALEMANVERIIEQNKGIFCCVGTFIHKDLETAKQELATVGANFWICMPYSFGHNTLIFASKKYHPQAEIVLQVSDLLEGCNYYNTELQNSSFIHPTYITKAITGIAKR